MKLINAFASSSIVQTVNVLSNDSGKLAFSFKLCQSIVSGIRLCVEAEHFFTVKFIEIRKMIAIESSAQYCFRREFIFLIIKTVNASEIGDTAFC